MKKLNQKGVGLVEVLLILAILGVIGFVGYRIMQGRNNVAEVAQDTSTEQPAEETQETEAKEYTNSEYGFSFNYPATWTLNEKSEENVELDQPAIYTITLTSPDNTVLELMAHFGGKGGYCEPAASDVAHQVGNTCATSEILAKAETGLTASSTSYDYSYDPDVEEPSETTADFYIVDHKFSTGGAESTTKYGICLALEDNISGAPFKLNDPQMGVYTMNFPNAIYRTSPEPTFFYLDGCATSDSEELFTSDDAVNVRAIFLTLEVDGLTKGE